MGKMRHGALGLIGIFAICGLAAGCSDAASEDDSTGSTAQTVFEGKPPVEFVDKRGNRFIQRGKARIIKAPLNEDGRPAIPSVVSEVNEDDITAALAQETVESLANKLRGVAEIDGYEYEAAEPPYELARKILDGAKQVQETPASPDMEADSFRTEEQEGRQIIDDDTRSVVRNNTSNPFRTMVQFADGCSGTLVSPTTIVTAAHCVYNTTTNAWYSKPLLGRGADAGDSVTYPYGQFSTCYTRWVTNAWIDAPSNGDSSAGEWDYCAIELDCSQSSSHWMGTLVASESTIEGRSTYLYGYPTGKSPYPQIWGAGKTAGGTYVSGDYMLKHWIDTTGGQSGSAIYLFNDSSERQVVGIHRGATGDRNIAKRWDSRVYNFVDTYTDFPEDIP